MEVIHIDPPWSFSGSFFRAYPPQTRIGTIRDDAVAHYRTTHETIGDGPHALSLGETVLSLDLTLEELESHLRGAGAWSDGGSYGTGQFLRLVSTLVGPDPKEPVRLA